MKRLTLVLYSITMLGIGSALTFVVLGHSKPEIAQPYAGQDGRQIASLSAKDVDDLIAGRGWGFAKPAELNQYPGPDHVLELKEELALSDTQIGQIDGIFNAMRAEAQKLGKEFVEAEAELSESFRSKAIDIETLRKQIANASKLRGDLRASHLAAHLAVTPLLTQDQVAAYQAARGYENGHAHTGH